MGAATTELVPPPVVYPKGTVAEIIERYIVEMNGADGRPGLKQLGPSHEYTLRMWQRSATGRITAKNLAKQHIKDHCLGRNRGDGTRAPVCPATINQDLCYLSGVLKYAGAEWDDCEDVSAGAIEAARPWLIKMNLIGKSLPRKRVPTDDEEKRLHEYFVEKDKRSKIRMVEVIAFSRCSTRRISEITRMTHGDIEWYCEDAEGNSTPMYTVRDLKHPTKKRGNDKRFPLLDPMPEIILRQPRLTPNNPDERVFPFNAKSVGQAYTRAKKELGIVDLRFHDNRRAAITYWLTIFPPHKVRLISGHETTHILERVYDGSKSESLHGEAARLIRARQEQVSP